MRGNTSNQEDVTSPMHRFAGVLVAILLVIALAAPQGAQAGPKAAQATTFEDLLTDAVTVEEEQLLALANQAMDTCVCDDEFARNECREQAAEARKELNRLRNTTIKLGVKSGSIALGTFDFKRKQFPASMRGPLKSKPRQTAHPSCEYQEFRCAKDSDVTFADMGLPRSIESSTLVAAAPGSNFDAAVVWKGSIAVADTDRAKELRDDSDGLLGEAVYRVVGFEIVKVEDRTLARAKATLSQAVRKEIAKQRARGGYYKERAEEIGVPRLRCLDTIKSATPMGVVRLKPMGIRLWTKDVSVSEEYLVSQPASSIPRTAEAMPTTASSKVPTTTTVPAAVAALPASCHTYRATIVKLANCSKPAVRTLLLDLLPGLDASWANTTAADMPGMAVSCDEATKQIIATTPCADGHVLP